MSIKENVLKMMLNDVISDLYEVADSLDEYLTDIHKSKVHLAKKMKNFRITFKTFEDRVRIYKRWED